MRLLFLLALASAVTASAQRNNVVLDAINNSVRMAEQIRSAQALRESAAAMHETSETLKVERDRIRAETELLREETLQIREQRRASETTSDTSGASDQKEMLSQTIKELSDTYGDIEPYGERMMQLQNQVFLPPYSELRGDKLYFYILGLYLVARWCDDDEFEAWLRLPTDPSLAKQPGIPPAPTDVHQAAQTR